MRIFCLIALFLLLPLSVSAERLALVVGNGSYDTLDDLQNPHFDAEAYAAAFDDLGFQVVYYFDLTGDELLAALERFKRRVAPGDTVAFVYSGHGWSDGHTNFLVPTDTPLDASADMLPQLAVPIQNGRDGVLEQLEAAGTELIVAIIDACRNNPFGARMTDVAAGSRVVPSNAPGMQRGLALQSSAPSGSFVIYSAGRGQTALDRLPDDPPTERLSVFTRTFIPMLKQQITLEDAIGIAQVETAKLASRYPGGHTQHPGYIDETLGETCLNDRCREPKVGAVARRDWARLAFEQLSDLRAAEGRRPVVLDDTKSLAAELIALKLANGEVDSESIYDAEFEAMKKYKIRGSDCMKSMVFSHIDVPIESALDGSSYVKVFHDGSLCDRFEGVRGTAKSVGIGVAELSNGDAVVVTQVYH
ncbi:MAG: hypothetical protein CSA72_02700 [Rhodobacterales bacterium]|nr:MAG: hypothetical protein CSA72_02700 [Rhodobacterales bacterium]